LHGEGIERCFSLRVWFVGLRYFKKRGWVVFEVAIAEVKVFLLGGNTSTFGCYVTGIYRFLVLGL
jgi:hypothetical protein